MSSAGGAKLRQWAHYTETIMHDTRHILPREQLQLLQRKSAWRAGSMLAVNWGLVAASFALVAWRPGVPSVLAAMLVLGGRQLGLGILMHECAHRSLFPSQKVNDWVGRWLCAAPMFADLEVYRAYHMTHHVKTGTDADPDLQNYAGYPVSRSSMLRKVGRDLAGLTGLKALATLAVLYSYEDPRALKFGYAYRKTAADAVQEPATEAAAQPRRHLRHLLWNVRRMLLVHGLALAALWAAGMPLLYLLWPASWLTSYMLFSRIRNAAEHGALPGTMSTDPWTNTRTVTARWWERLTVAPNYVNFHFEHHLAPTVPSYNLPALHHWLDSQGILARAQVAHGYPQVIRALIV
jgi:fatty acid desaturase